MTDEPKASTKRGPSMFGWLPASATMTFPVDPPVPEGLIPFLPPPVGMLTIVAWDRNSITITNNLKRGVPYLVTFVPAAMAQGLMHAAMAIQSFRGGKK